MTPIPLRRELLASFAVLTDLVQVSPGDPITLRLNGQAGNNFALTVFMEQLEASTFLRGVSLIQSQQEFIGPSGNQQVVSGFSLEVDYVQPPMEFLQTVPLFGSGEVTSQARQLTGLDPAQFRPEPDEPGQFYTRKAYQMQAIGDYHDIARFLTSIASLSRIITPVDLGLSPYTGPAGVTDAENPVVADFRIETYVLPPPSEMPPAAQVGG